MKSELFSAGLIVGVGRFLSQMISSLRIVCVAWILAPDSVGVFGFAAGIMTLVQVCSETGMRSALIQRKGDVSEYISTVWVGQIFRGIMIALLILSTAPLFAAFYERPELKRILFALAFVPIIQGFENVGLILQERDLRFGRIVIIDFLVSAIDLATTLSIALIYPTPFALVAGQLVRAIFRVLAGFFAERRRPAFKFDWIKFKSLYAYGFWIFFSTIIGFVLIRGSDFYIGKKLGFTELGVFQVAYTLACVPLVQLMTIVNRVTFPALSRLQTDKASYANAFGKLFWATNLLVCATVIFFSLTADVITKYLFSDKYSEIAELLPVLAIWGGCRALGGMNSGALNAFGVPKYSVVFQLVMTAVLMILIVPLTNYFGIMGAAYSLAIAGIVGQLSRYSLIHQVLGVSYRQLFRIVFVPILLATTILVGTDSMITLLPDGDFVIRSIVSTMTALASFFLAMCFLDRYFQYDVIASTMEQAKARLMVFRSAAT
ncbi:Lipopolysaccharide biosynthesis protein WzxC [Planctomycetes bacterium CA13]|uniref:Lipopolysaccharide biosynthesis protein WzxC n=2 Tax=Novipirellula herctigrandis TaxID=2527986 RepID=A0A5C5Z9S8_9BACT|nr:Lipopolysaccharide biosynthesis protein WzxC [Planctomycetes bacterium CA13]